MIRRNNLQTSIRRIIRPLPLLPVIMPDIVRIGFLKLFVSFGAEGAAPEDQGFFEGEADAFKEEAELHAAVVAEVAFL